MQAALSGPLWSPLTKHQFMKIGGVDCCPLCFQCGQRVLPGAVELFAGAAPAAGDIGAFDVAGRSVDVEHFLLVEVVQKIQRRSVVLQCQVDLCQQITQADALAAPDGGQPRRQIEDEAQQAAIRWQAAVEIQVDQETHPVHVLQIVAQPAHEQAVVEIGAGLVPMAGKRDTELFRGVAEIGADLVGAPGMAGSIFERQAQGGVAGQPAADFGFAPALFRIAQQQPAQKLALRLIG